MFKDLGCWFLLLTMAHSQIALFSGSVAAMFFVVVAAATFLYMLVSGKIVLSFRVREWVLVTTLLLMVLLGFLLELFGQTGEFPQRQILVFSILQVLVSIVIISMLKKPGGWLLVVNVLSIVLLLELLIVYLQFSYLTIGYGLRPEQSESFGMMMARGSFGNPNNSATLIGLFSVCIFFLLSMANRPYSAMLVGTAAFPALFILMSRAMILVWALGVLAFAIVSIVKRSSGVRFSRGRTSVVAVALLVVSLGALGHVVSAFEGYSQIERSLAKVASLADVVGDASVNFRLLSHKRLAESIGNLGVGSFSDRNYTEYFESGDPWLVTVNPHSLIAEYSFLFGYSGVIAISALVLVIIYGIAMNSHWPLIYKCVLIFSVLVAQSVPSSLLEALYYLPPLVVVSFIGPNKVGLWRA